MSGSPLAWVVCLFARLLPHIPNVEPILAAQMVLGSGHSARTNFLFACSNIVCLDALTAHLGLWTIVTAISYGLLGVAATYYFRQANANYFVFAVFGTLAYDIITCMVAGPILFGQPCYATLIAQMPFSCAHLGGNLLFALVLHIVSEIKAHTLTETEKV